MYSERIDKSLIYLGAEGLIEWEELLAVLHHNQANCAVNITNHPSDKWCEEQRKPFGKERSDIPFPEIEFDSNFDRIADSIYDRLRSKGCDPSNSTIVCQGQHPATFSIVACLINSGWTVLAAHTPRVVTDNPDGSKTSVFKFNGYQKYHSRYVQQYFLEDLFKRHFGEQALL